jgi:hypothetical protein
MLTVFTSKLITLLPHDLSSAFSDSNGTFAFLFPLSILFDLIFLLFAQLIIIIDSRE